MIDYNSEAQENLMEYELYDEGLTYRYVYGEDKLGVTVYPIANGSASITTPEQTIPLYYHMDYMGSSEFLTSDVTQRVTSWTSYDEWGNITHNAVLKCGKRELDLVKNYTGHERDSVLGMYYAKARLYDTADKHGSTKGNKLGDKRFLAVDPVKGDTRNPQSMVQYTYTLNNPLMYVDPLGEMSTLLLNAISNQYNMGAITDEQVAQAILAIEFAGLNKTLTDELAGNGAINLEQVADLASKSFKNGNNNNFYLASHEITQVLAGKDIAQDKISGKNVLLETVIRYTGAGNKEMHVEADITQGRYFWEVKPRHNTSGLKASILKYSSKMSPSGKKYIPGPQPNKNSGSVVVVSDSSNYGKIYLHYMFGEEGMKLPQGAVGYWYSYSCDPQDDSRVLVAPKVADEAIKEYDNARLPGMERAGYAVFGAAPAASNALIAQLSPEEIQALQSLASQAGKKMTEFAVEMTIFEWLLIKTEAALLP